jgi:HEAT repeats
MTKPSKPAAAFLACFGLMFLVPSLVLLFTVVGKSPTLPQKIAGASISLVLAAVGGGLVAAGLVGYRRLKQQMGTEEANPSSPWLWRADWASRRANGQDKNREIRAWIFCVLGNLFVLPFAISMVPSLAQQSNPLLFLIVGFCCIGPVLLVYAVRVSLSRHRFGDTYFEFDSLPFSPGGRLSGRIHLRFTSEAPHGIDLRLSCIRQTIVQSGNNRSTAQAVLWQADKNVPSGAIGMDAFGRTIPVDFALPGDAYVTDQDNASDQVLWKLHAQGDIPGIDYSDDFEVPVFRTSTAAVPPGSESFSSGFAPVSDSVNSDSTPVSAPDRSRVAISLHDGGTEFYFPPFRNPARALILLLFTLVWSGIVVFLFHSKAPWFFGVVFGFFDVFLILGAFQSLVGTARIVVGNGEIVSTKRVLGIGGTKRFPISSIDSVVPLTSAQQGGNVSSAMYAIRLRTKDGRRCKLADEIASRQEARWIVSQIESLAGLKVDTRVEVSVPLGVVPEPPQPAPGSATSTSALAAVTWPQAKKSSRVSAVVPFLVFASFVAGMFAWQGWRFADLKAVAGASRAHGAAATPSPSPVPAPRIFTPLANADIPRVLALPAQEQAEELLERAIEHDPKALELFQKNVESWTGHIHLTERMKQLERRSEYSSDLRVRYANADINLALDGWQENEQAADLLIERARTDREYRAAAVYFLGMLAGRGVAYEKIHPVLLNYAQHDSDAYVRQWAVEGMRYLGKDEALDELFESFTHDPSYNVRDRAGCNISDCGNFTRAQRMLMVPKLIELVSDPATNSQMRSWSFMALNGITDANLPSDPQAWSSWYTKHGAEKLAEFQRLEWWQVRGDE